MSKRKQWSPEKRARRARAKTLNTQQKAANVRKKYGPGRKPAPVVVKSLGTGEVLGVHDQSKFTGYPKGYWVRRHARSRK